MARSISSALSHSETARIGVERLAEGCLVGPGALRGALDEPIGCLSIGALGDHRQQQRLGVHHPAEALEVGAHPIGIDLEPVEDVGGRTGGIGGDPERALEDEALGRAVADVALVPEGHVLEADDRVGAQQPRHAGDPLGEDRVALVWHRARSLLTGAEGLEGLPDLCALEVADLDRDALQRSAQDREGGEQLGVAVTADDLRRRRVRGQAKPAQDVALHVGADVGMGADRPRDRADADDVPGPRQAVGVALELGEPAGGLEAEGDRLGVDPVRAADHRRVAMLEREPADDLDEPRQLSLDDAGRVAQDDRGRRVEHVRARQPVMEPAALGPEPLGDRAQEGNDVVLRLPLDLVRSLRVDVPDLVANALEVGPRHDAGLGHRLERQHLDLQPQLELVPLPEDLAQLRQRVSVDHARGSTRSSAFPACSSRNARTRAATASSDSARMRAARWPAFFAPAEPMATVATGTPGGIWTTA